MTQGDLSLRSRVAPWLITLCLLAVAAAAAVPLVLDPIRPAINWWLLGLFFLAFLAGESIIVRLELGREGMTVSIVEIPLVLSLFVLPPIGVLATRLLAAALVQFNRTRDVTKKSRLPGDINITKLAFNIALFAAATAVANAVVAPFTPLSVTRPEHWLVALGAVLAAGMVTFLAVSTVITVVQRTTPVRSLVRTGASALLVGLFDAVVGLVVLLAVTVSEWAVLLVAVLAVVASMGYRAYAQFVRQHQSLSQLYDITREVRSTRSEGELADILLARARSLLKSEYATLWLPESGRYPELLLTAQEGRPGLLDSSPAPAAFRERVCADGSTIAVGPKTGDKTCRAVLAGTGLKDVIAVPLRSGTAVIGCLEVTNRLGDISLFNAGDVKLLETLAAHTAVAVENSRLVDRLRFDAYHDSLTGLPNRHRMLTALEESVRVRAPGEVVAVLVFDVDGLRDVNDSLGHAAGDKLLAEVGRRLRSHAPAGALVGRIGGDEFALSLRIGNVEEATALAAHLRRSLQDPMPFGSLRLDVDAVVGLAIHPDHGSEPEVLLQRADLATFGAKSTQAGIQVFNLGLESRSVRRLGLAGDLRRAIDHGELEVYFQPKIAIRRRELVGVECLARWKHPAHGWVAPEDFVTVAEHTGQLGRLTDLVLREGLRRCRDWVGKGHPLGVAVNLSPRTLVDPAFAGYLEELISEYGVAPELLTLEITEDGVIAETDRPLPTLRRLRDIGVRLSVDDFGTGYSSLSYLRQLPVQEVKIDRTFVQGMATDPGDYAIVRAVVDLSRHFGLEVVAEGVESELALSQLAEIGCDVGQGFFFSRPLSYDRLTAWLAARTEVTPAVGEIRRLRVVP